MDLCRVSASLLRRGRAMSAAAATARAAAADGRRRNYSDMSFTFAAPHGVHYNEATVRQVDVPSFSGAFGILPQHVPALAVLKPGVVTVYEDDGARKFFVSSGSITVNADSSVQILAEEAHPLDAFDAAAAKAALAEAQSAMGVASTDEAKAEAQIAVETAEELVKAIEG